MGGAFGLVFAIAFTSMRVKPLIPVAAIALVAAIAPTLVVKAIPGPKAL
jgi:hypothetical protein